MAHLFDERKERVSVCRLPGVTHWALRRWLQLDAADGKFRAMEDEGIFVRFQKKHWFDGAITIYYLKCLKKMYGSGGKIGLI